jgi:hypothetical protein
VVVDAQRALARNNKKISPVSPVSPARNKRKEVKLANTRKAASKRSIKF